MSYLSSYMRPATLGRAVDNLCRLAIDKRLEFDTVVFRGVSGALVAPGVALKLGKLLAVCRKPTEKAHCSAGLETSYLPVHRYVIVDDFICSGSTIRAILEDVKAREPSAVCVGVLLYADKPEDTYCDKSTFPPLYGVMTQTD